MSTLSSSFTTLLSSVQDAIHTLPYNLSQLSPLTKGVFLGGSAVLVLFGPSIYRNYVAYLYLSKNSGLPQNVFGWTFANCLTALGREVFSTEQYDKDVDKSTWIPGGPILRRKGERPQIGWQCVPHRQITQRADERIVQKWLQTLAAYAKQRPDLVSVQRSQREGDVESLWIQADIPVPPPSAGPNHPVIKDGVKEIAHIHERTDHSTHVQLSPQDCKTVIEAGWGERHPLSGVVKLPKEYLMIYAPRDEEEVEVVLRIVRGAVGFMTGRADA